MAKLSSTSSQLLFFGAMLLMLLVETIGAVPIERDIIIREIVAAEEAMESALQVEETSAAMTNVGIATKADNSRNLKCRSNGAKCGDDTSSCCNGLTCALWTDLRYHCQNCVSRGSSCVPLVPCCDGSTCTYNFPNPIGTCT